MIRNDRETRQFNIEEQQTFLRILHRDSRGGAIICNQFHNGTMISQEVTKEVSAIQCESVENDIYVSVNSFKSSGGQFTSRRSDNVYSLNAMYIDLDLPGHKRDENSETIFQENLDVIHHAVSEHRLPKYTMITSTGNGLGVFFVLTNSIANTKRTEKQQQYFDTLYDLLAERMKEILSECGDRALIVDSSVVGDHARICRLPGTRNSKSGTMCTILEANEMGCGSLSEYRKVLSKEKTQKRSIGRKNTGEKRFVSSFYHAQLLMKLEALAKGRSSWKGHREVFCFVYYNTAKQCMEYQNAVKALYQFNDDLGERISGQRIKSIIRAVDSNVAYDGSYAGYYKLTNAWISNKLGLDDNEIEKYGLDGGCSWEDRNQQAHLDVVRKRLDTERKVVELLTADERPTYDAVSVSTGASIATVKRIAMKYRVRKCDSGQAESIDWDALYKEIEDEYKEQRLNACKNRIKTCISVVVTAEQEPQTERTLCDETFVDGLNESSFEPTMGTLQEDDKYTECNGWISTELSFNELTNGINPFDFDRLDVTYAKTNDVSVLESDKPSISAGEIFELNTLYGDSFLDYLMERAGERTLKMYQGFADVFYGKIRVYNDNQEFRQSNLLYVLLDMIADKYRTSVSVDLCLGDLDKLYRFVALDSCNLRDYEIKVSRKAASHYVAPSSRFVHIPTYEEPVNVKHSAGANTHRMRTRELDKSDLHMLKIAHLLDTDAFLHMRAVLVRVIDSCNTSVDKHENDNGKRLAGLLMHIPTFGEKRIETLMKTFEPISNDICSDTLITLLCDTLHCKPDTLGTMKNDISKIKYQSPAQKKASQMYRRHQDTISWCRREQSHNITCRTFLNSYHVLSSDKYKDQTFTIDDKPVSRDEIRKKYLYPVSIDTLKTMPVLYNMTDLVNWILCHKEAVL